LPTVSAAVTGADGAALAAPAKPTVAAAIAQAAMMGNVKDLIVLPFRNEWR
jgi:hypothetical protein